MNVHKMRKKDKQHYVPQSYLRKISPDFLEYKKTRDNLEDKQKKTIKRKLKIHFYDIDSNSFGYGNISSLAEVDHYLPPSVDKIIQKTKNKMKLLQKIIKNRSENLLYQKDNQETIWEIGNCLKARAFAFRHLVNLIYIVL